MKKSFKIVMAAFFLILMLVGSSLASFNGAIYEGDSTAAFQPSNWPTPGIIPTYFTVDQLNFDSRLFGGVATYSQFLGGPGNVNNLVWIGAPLTGNIVTAPDPNYPSFTLSPSAYGTFFQFAGTAYFPANITITHDDGFWLNLGGTIYDFSTPTSPELTTLTNAAGSYNFVLNYGAWNSFPEVLIVPTPEPTTLLLLGLGLIGMTGVRRFKK
jgi:hypothetical protein